MWLWREGQKIKRPIYKEHKALKMHDEHSGVSTEIGCFKGTFSLQVKDDTKKYQVPLWCVYVWQDPFKKEL